MANFLRVKNVRFGEIVYRRTQHSLRFAGNAVTHIQMARELGLDLKDFGSLAKTKPWKLPLNTDVFWNAGKPQYQ